jgi:hypothetical protein
MDLQFRGNLVGPRARGDNVYIRWYLVHYVLRPRDKNAYWRLRDDEMLARHGQRTDFACVPATVGTLGQYDHAMTS